MRIGGYDPLSLIDYPERCSSVIFTLGCNFRCSYCHNPQLVLPHCFAEEIPEKEILAKLERGRRLLSGVVITGGEPTIHVDLPSFIKRLAVYGLPIKLDTNGSNPKMLQRILSAQLVDAVAMDIKHPVDEYAAITPHPPSAYALKESIQILLESKIAFYFRITKIPGLTTTRSLEKVRELLPPNVPLYEQELRRNSPLVGELIAS